MELVQFFFFYFFYFYVMLIGLIDWLIGWLVD